MRFFKHRSEGCIATTSTIFQPRSCSRNKRDALPMTSFIVTPLRTSGTTLPVCTHVLIPICMRVRNAYTAQCIPTCTRVVATHDAHSPLTGRIAHCAELVHVLPFTSSTIILLIYVNVLISTVWRPLWWSAMPRPKVRKSIKNDTSLFLYLKKISIYKTNVLVTPP